MSYRQKHITPKIRQLRRKKRLFQSRWFWFVVLAVILAVVMAYFYFFSPKVQVLQVEVMGNEALDVKEIETVAWAKISRQVLGMESASIFGFSKKKLQDHVREAFPALEKVSVQKHFFGRVSVIVAERAPVGVFCGNKQSECFFIDLAGIAFDPVAPAPQDVIIFRGETEAQAGRMVVERDIVEGVLAVAKNLKNSLQIDVIEAAVSRPLIIKTSERWKMYFDPSADMNAQISRMNALLNEITPASRKRLQYIYLQYKDRAYYK